MRVHVLVLVLGGQASAAHLRKHGDDTNEELFGLSGVDAGGGIDKGDDIEDGPTLHESTVVGRFALPANKYAAEPIVPGVGSFDDPSARSAATTTTLSLTASANVRYNPSSPDCSVYVGVVVPFVQT